MRTEVVPVAVMIEDLYFMSIISSAAGKVRVPVRFLRRGEMVPERASLLLIDVQFPGEWDGEVRRFVDGGGKALAFGPHMDGETRQRAKAAEICSACWRNPSSRGTWAIFCARRRASGSIPPWPASSHSCHTTS